MNDNFRLGLKVAGVALALGIGVLALNIVTAPVYLANKTLSSAQGVVSKTIDPNNVLLTYERFHDRFAVYKGRVAQIASTKRFLHDETNVDERNRLRVELVAQQMSCRELANAYNADSVKSNRAIFKGREVPETLDASACE